jgi:hypothetical protein
MVNTTEDYEYVEADDFEVDHDGNLTAMNSDSQIIGGWSNGFWLSYKNTEKVVAHVPDDRDELS